MPSLFAASPQLEAKGIVCDKKTHTPLSFATIRFISPDGKTTGSISDINGQFHLQSLSAGQYKISVTYVGYEEAKQTITLSDSTFLVFYLKPSSNALKEVVVTASESKGITSASKIDRTAMEHLQPTSFTDLLALLPGGSTHTPDMSAPNLITLREVGIGSSDYNTTSLGTQFVIDGAPMNTNAHMQQVDTEITNQFGWKTAVNAGVDMRAISTDNIESVEIIRGIPSVEYGDLTSGVVIINRRLKPTPLEARFKADQYSKLLSIGKGIEWTEHDINLSVDGGFLDSQSDPRNPLDNYKRINASARLSKKWYLPHEYQLVLNSNLDYSGNIDSDKNDPEILSQPEDRFRSSYHSGQWQNHLRWNAPANKAFRYLDFRVSASYSFDQIKRSRFVQLDRARVAPINMEEGVHDATILPYQYTAHLTVDGRPLNLYAGLKSAFRVHTGPVSHNLLVGATWSYAKNFGGGQMYDPNRPLNPMSSASRPRKYSDIPASSLLSAYAEDRMFLTLGGNIVELQAGVRGVTQLNVDKRYGMYGKCYFDPRVNAQWRFPGITLGKDDLVFSISGGLGWLTKMPTLLQLYPDPIYMDITQLNFWHKNKDYRRFNQRTYIEDPTNFDLKPARNFKYEARIGMEYDHNDFSVTYFREKLASGFRNESQYHSYAYRKYDADGVDHSTLTGPPALEALPYEDKLILRGYGMTGNGSMTDKEGVEFQFSSKRFDVINTRLTINGAWFRSTYKNSLPMYRSQWEVIENVALGDIYVGLYENEDNYIREQFNTNFIVDTWLEKIGVKLSETVECSWFQSKKTGYVNGTPISYMDVHGQVHPFTEADKEDKYKMHLVENFNDAYFDKTTIPFYLYVNFKATKDFGKVSVSLFADRIFDYVPDYRHNGTLVRRTAASPYFGMEMNLKL